MISLEKFLNPSWKKLGWFFIVFLIAQLYSQVIIGFIPTQIMQQFINFILNPANLVLEEQTNFLALPIANTVNLIWQYILATILAREISHEK